MAATTITAIRSALETLIAGLTPAGTDWGRTTYIAASSFRDWEDRPDADRDRQFTVDDIDPGQTISFSGTNEILRSSKVTIIVGHKKGNSISTAKGRRDRDCEQIVQNMIKPANRPAGVAMFEYAGVSLSETDKYFRTDIEFEMVYISDPP